jgi:hypothetical protein
MVLCLIALGLGHLMYCILAAQAWWVIVAVEKAEGIRYHPSTLLIQPLLLTFRMK